MPKTKTPRSESSGNLFPKTKDLRSESSKNLLPKTNSLRSESSENLLPYTETLGSESSKNPLPKMNTPKLILCDGSGLVLNAAQELCFGAKYTRKRLVAWC